eukprot:Hpha_TRINITY_DN15781_c1_g1::TRINITY_DN15781_c1_g1_i2::g.40755::m.40755
MAAATMRSVAEALEVKVPGWDKMPMDERFLGDDQSVLLMAIAYLVSLSVLKAKAHGTTKFAGVVKTVSSVNNVIMCLYSLYAFVGMSLVLAANWVDDGFPVWKAICDTEKTMNRGLDFWMYHFYLSKFWEWIDTWILVLKGKPVWPPENSQFFLHVFHHCVTASVFWVSWRKELPMGYLGPLTNAFVHIPMYGYYFITEHWQGARMFGVFITPTQIVQFLIVMAGMIPSTLSPSECGATKRAVVWWWFCYTVWLVLFTKMFLKKKAARSAALSKRA